MSCNTEQDVRIIMKYSTISGVEPTIPLSADHNDGTWLPTDIYIGEIFVNSADDLTWIRTNNGIIPLSGSFSATFSFAGDFVPISGGTFSGLVNFSELTSASASIDQLYIDNIIGGYISGSFSGDGSGLTGITTEWNGGTVSNGVYFTNTVDISNTLNLNGPIVGDLNVTGDAEISGGVSASIFYGDGSGLTNLPTGTYSDVYTTSAALSGNTIVFDRNDSLQYSVDLTPILGTQGVASMAWDSSLNSLQLTLLDGSIVSTPIDGFNILTAITSVNAPEFYGGVFYGEFVGTYSNDIYTLSADLIGTEQIFTRTDGSTYSTDLSSLAGGGGGSQSLSQTLLIGNSTGANDIIIENGQYLRNGLTSSSIFYDDEILDIRVSDELYDNLTERTPNLLHSNVNDLTNGDLTDIIQGFLEGGPAIILDVTTSGGDEVSRVSLAPSTVELRTESEAEDRLITDTISDTNIVTSISMPTDPNTYYSETSNIFQNETIITNSEYTIVQTTDAIIPKQETRITQPNINDTQSLRLQEVGYIRDEAADGVNQSSSTLTVESINHSVLSGEGQEDYININNDGVTLGEVEGSSFTNFIVNNDNGFYKSQFQSTGISKGVSKERFVSVETTNGVTASVVYPLSDLEVETGAIAVKATVTAFNASPNDKAYVAELYAAVRINSYTPTIISAVDKTEKTEFTTATSTIEIESSNLAILVKGETGETIFWSIKYELIYSVPFA